MSNINISVPYGDCILSVSHSKRTVSLIRSGKKGEILKQKHNVLNGDWESAFLPLSAQKKHRGFVKNYRQSQTSQIEKSNQPEFERGWIAVEKTAITTVQINTNNLSGIPSVATRKELGMPKDKLPYDAIIIGIIHDLAYEIARNGGHHCLSWTLQNITTGNTISTIAEWKDGKITFTFTSKTHIQ